MQYPLTAAQMFVGLPRPSGRSPVPNEFSALPSGTGGRYSAVDDRVSVIESMPKTLAKKVGTPGSVMETLSWCALSEGSCTCVITETPVVNPLLAATSSATVVAWPVSPGM